MRKVILTGAALVAFAAAGFAQNTSTLNQTGTRNDANIQQTGNTHTATVTQNGNSVAPDPKQRAIVQQSTTGNQSTIDQRTAASTTGDNASNLAETYQTSGGNKAFVNQLDGSRFNRAGITQQTAGNVANAGNEATINQSQNSGGIGERGNGAIPAGDGNWAGILQDGMGNKNTTITQSNVSQGNFAEIRQYGNNNGTKQNGTNLQGVTPQGPQTRIEQSGNSFDNTANIFQGSSGAPVNDNTAVIRQVNSTNSTGTVNQLSNDNYVNIRQVGAMNTSTTTQQGGTNNSIESQALGNNNQETLTQTGANNQIYIRFEPENSTNLSDADNHDNVINMTQTGNSNRSVLDLRASQTNATVTQLGNDNYSRFQVGDDNAGNDPVGVDNDLTVFQNRNITGSGSSGNHFNGEVRGDQNKVDINQVGEGNRFGTSNFEVRGLLIDGDGNQINSTQTGRKNKVNMQILGQPSNDGNIVTINQTSPTAASTTGNSIGTLNDGNETDERGLEISGDNNNVELTQNGNGNSINMSINGGAAGAGNQVDIVQTGNNNKVGTGGGLTTRGLFITGNSNMVDISQDGGDETQAKQNGNDELTVKQQAGSISTSNLIKIDQGGTGTGKQIATLTQNGDANIIQGVGGAGSFATQNGMGVNTATITQTGSAGFGNVMSLNQTGAGNMVMVTQNNPSVMP